jgi:ATP-dependent RNA helicase MSS116
LALKKDHKFISTLSEDDTNVHEHVRQELALVPQEDVLPLTMAALLREEAKDPNFKGKSDPECQRSISLTPVIVFLPTARAAALFHDVFQKVGAFPVWEIHSRLSQSKRTNTTEAFRQAQKGVLFSSDVTARGIDIKGITAVVQAGAPMNAEQCGLIFSPVTSVQS